MGQFVDQFVERRACLQARTPTNSETIPPNPMSVCMRKKPLASAPVSATPNARVIVGITTNLKTLSARGTDVLRLISRGLSNTEIAEQLHVSERTTKSHVASSLTKLGVRDRLQAVIHAYETGFIQPGDNPT